MDACPLAPGFATAALLLALSGYAAFDRAAGTGTGGVHPDGTPANPPGMAATCALDRAAVSDAYPRNEHPSMRARWA